MAYIGTFTPGRSGTVDINQYIINACYQFYPQAYVWKNNVYVKASPTGAVMQVTTNGKDNLILNGIPDWVYEG